MSTISTPITVEELGTPLELRPNDLLSVKLGDTADEFMLVISDRRGRDHFPSSAATHGFAKRLPERKEVPGLGGTAWRAPATDITCQLIHTLWPQAQVVFDDQARVIYMYNVLVLVQQTLMMERNAKYHEYIRWRNALTENGHEYQPGPAESIGCREAGGLGLQLGDRAFVTDEGLFALHYPWDISPAMHLANEHEGMLHQSLGAQNMAAAGVEGYGLFFEPGTGKTSTAIYHIDRMSMRPQHDPASPEGTAYRALIVVPNNIALNWENEFREFSTVPGSVVVMRGLVIDRIKLLIETLQNPDKNRYLAIIISYELLSNMWDYLGAIEWDLALLDESHYIKWPTTKRAQTAHKLRDKAKQRVCLTGTPICNTAIDLYSQLEFMRKGGSGFSTFKSFCDFYGVYETTDETRGSRRLVDVQNMPFLQERLARMSTIVTKAEALPDLPEKQRDVVEVVMTDQQARIYRDIQVKLLAEIEADIENATDRRVVNANNILTKMLRLAQVTSGFVAYDADIDPETGEVFAPKGIDRLDPNQKIEAMMTLFKDPETGALVKGPDSKTIIWACWVQDIRTIAARLAVEGIDAVTFYGSSKPRDRQEAERRFNEDPSCKVFVGNPGCGGVGLNLIGYPPRRGDEYTTNCDHVIYFSQDWSMPKRGQSEDRANRRGTRVITRITDLCVAGTIDEEIRGRVLNKKMMAMKTQDLRKVLSKVLGRDKDKSLGQLLESAGGMSA